VKEAPFDAPSRGREAHQLQCVPAKRRRDAGPVHPVVTRPREASKLGEQPGLVIGLEEPHRPPEAQRIAVHHTPEQDVPANGLAGDVRASHPGASAVEDVLDHDPVARLDREHTVEAEPRGGDSRRHSPLLRGQAVPRRVTFRRGAAARQLTVVVEPGGENLQIVVDHRAIGPDEFLQRRVDLLTERLRRPTLDAATDRVVKARLASGPLLLGQAAPLVLETAATRAGAVPCSRHMRSP
jgi:hypothetical protein